MSTPPNTRGCDECGITLVLCEHMADEDIKQMLDADGLRDQLAEARELLGAAPVLGSLRLDHEWYARRDAFMAKVSK